MSAEGAVLVEFDHGLRRRTLADEELSRLRLDYARHIHRAQGATVQRALIVTGGWQTSKESTYVEASRARQGTDWFVNREELGIEGQDPERVGRLAELMRSSRAQTPSLEHRELHEAELGPERYMPRAPLAPSEMLPGLARVIARNARAHSEPERSR